MLIMDKCKRGAYQLSTEIFEYIIFTICKMWPNKNNTY